MPDLENPLENCLWAWCIMNSYACISLIVHPPLESLDPPLSLGVFINYLNLITYTRFNYIRLLYAHFLRHFQPQFLSFLVLG